MNRNRNPLVARLALAIPETRRELGLSISQAARLARVSSSTLTKIEHGGRVNEALVVQVGAALLTLELHAPPPPSAFEPLALVSPPRAHGDVDRHGDLFGDAA